MSYRPIWRAAVAGLAYFGIVFAVAFALGTLRTLVVSPRFGEIVGVLVELPMLLAASWTVCRWLVARFDVPASSSLRMVMGGVAFAVLMLAELGGATIGFGRTLPEYFDQYRRIPGLLGHLGQIAFAWLPVIQSTFGTQKAT